jgi:hypothetical protein
MWFRLEIAEAPRSGLFGAGVPATGVHTPGHPLANVENNRRKGSPFLRLRGSQRA